MKPATRRLLARLAALALSTQASLPLLLAQNVSYVGPSGPTGLDNSWTLGSNWTGGVAPTTTAFSATINDGGTVFMPFVNVTINNFNLLNGTITGSALTVAGLSTIGDGATVGNNQLGAHGGITFQGSATLDNVNGLGTGNGVAAATASWGGGTLLFINSAAGTSSNAIWNAPSGLYDSVSGSNTFENRGTFNKTNAGTPSGGTLTIEPVFNQKSTGTLNVNAGELQLIGGGFLQGATNVLDGTVLTLAGTHTISGAGFPGSLSVAPTATLNIAGGTTTVDNPYNHVGTATVASGATLVLRGDGTHSGVFAPSAGGAVNFSAGTHTITAAATHTGAGSFNVNSLSNVQLAAGVALTGNGSFTLNGGTLSASTSAAISNPFGFISGTIDGGTITLHGATTFSGGDLKRITGGAVLNIGDGVGAPGSVLGSWSGGSMDIRNAGVLNIRADAAFSTGFGGSINNNGGTLGTLNIEAGGSFTNNAGTTSIATNGNPLAFNNNGSVAVAGGVLAVGGSGASTGSWSVADGATLNFGVGTRSLDAGSVTAPGTGVVQFSSGVTSLGVGSYTVSGTTLLNGGTANFNSTASTRALTITSGTLGGTGTVNVTGPATWSGGLMGGAGTTNILDSITFDTADSKQINFGRILNIGGGTSTWSAGTIDLRGGTVNIKSGAELKATKDNDINNWGGALGTLNVEAGGTFTKNGGNGTTSIATNGNTFAFNNGGTVSVQTGTLLIGSLSQGGAHTGAFNVGGGSSLNLAGVHTLNAGASFSGAGNTVLTGTITDNGGTPFSTPTTLTGILTGPGATTFTGGLSWTLNDTTVMNGAGTTVLLANSTLGGFGQKQLSGGARRLDFGNGNTADGSLTVAWTTGSIRVDVGSVISNKADSTFAVSSDQSMNSSGSFLNQGTLAKTGTATTTFSLTSFSNTGTVEVTGGTLAVTSSVLPQLSGTTLTGGTWNVSNGAALNISAGSGIQTIGAAAKVGLDGTGSSFVKINSVASNQGEFKLSNNRSFTTTSSFTNSGQLIVADSPTTFTTNGTYTQTAGLTRLADNATLAATSLNFTGGTLAGTGNLVGPATFTNTTLAPGASPGLLAFSGDLTLASGNTLQFEIGGVAAGIGYDQITVGGALALGGSILSVSLIDSFTPSATDTFDLLVAGSPFVGVLGNIASGGTLILPEGSFTVTYAGANKVTLSNFTSAIPEPSSFAALAGLGALGFSALRRRRAAAR